MNTTERTVTVNDNALSYTLTRKRIKNAIMRITAEGIRVSAPLYMPLDAIDTFVTGNADAIARARQKLAEAAKKRPTPLALTEGETLPLFGISHPIALRTASRREAFVENGTLLLQVKNIADAKERYRAFCDFAEREAAKVLTARVADLTPLFAPKPPTTPTLSFRNMTSRWGVCRPAQGRVTLNRRLIFLPPALIDYVICHELAHFHHANHSAAFWQALSLVMPDCKARRKALNDYPIPLFEEELKK